MAELPILNEEQLRLLAKLIYYQEAEAIKGIKFNSKLDLDKYLNDSKAGHDSVLSILDAGCELTRKYDKDRIRAPIADDIFPYLIESVNMALQTVRNYMVRLNYLKKISDHSKILIKALDELDPGCATDVKRLAEKAAQYKNIMLAYTKMYKSTASRNFSIYLKDSGITFEELVRRYQAELKFQGPFKDLKDVQKLQVYEKIIEASGRREKVGNMTIKNMTINFELMDNGFLDVASLIYTAGTMVWDIFSSEHKIKSATEEAVKAAADKGGAMLKAIVEAALTTALVGIEGTTLFVAAVGSLASFGASFLITAAGGLLIDLIFNSGGSAPLSTDGHRCYVAPMPDGEVLARKIVHESSENSVVTYQ